MLFSLLMDNKALCIITSQFESIHIVWTLTMLVEVGSSRSAFYRLLAPSSLNREVELALFSARG